MGSTVGSKNVRPEEIGRPSDMGPPPAKLMVEAICQAAMTFPVGTGLGWDGIHPRAICRLNKPTLEWLADVLYYCETTGIWPEENTRNDIPQDQRLMQSLHYQATKEGGKNKNNNISCDTHSANLYSK